MDQVALVEIFAPAQPSAAHAAAIEDMREAALDQFAASAQSVSPDAGFLIAHGWRRPRRAPPHRLPLQAVLAIAIAAILAGANDLRAIFRWGRRLTPEALALFGIERAPCHATYHYVFRSLDGDALARALGGFARGCTEPGHIAIDGKTLRGSRRLDAKPTSPRASAIFPPSAAGATAPVAPPADLAAAQTVEKGRGRIETRSIVVSAHHLRELKALVEIEKEEWARKMQRLLRRACHAANLARE